MQAKRYKKYWDEIEPKKRHHLEEMIAEILKQKDESMHIILTGNRVTAGLLDYVDSVTTITTLGRDKTAEMIQKDE